MALDVGEKRIGVAISDPLGLTAQPFKVIDRTIPDRDIDVLNAIVNEHSICRIVVGIPYNIEGKPGKSAVRILEFVNRLRAAAGVRIDTWDERFTTAYSERLLIEAGLSRSRRKGKIDKIAAACILQEYLDKHNCERKTKLGKGCPERNL